MPHRDVIVMAASAGGIEALQAVIGGLPADLDAAVLVVLHMPPSGGHSLPRILSRAAVLPVAVGQDSERILPGHVYVCASDRHLLVGKGHLHVRTGPRENGHRPAADPLFRSAAGYYGPRVIGVILSGSLSDGTAGLSAIRQQGGLAVVQDPADALYEGMPKTALEYVGADHVEAAKNIGPLLAQLIRQNIPQRSGGPSETMRKEMQLMEHDDSVVEASHPGTPSPWPCPDCAGVLWEIDDDGSLLRFRCRVGHAWSAESLLQQQGQGVEAAMWMALRALEDRAALSRTLAERAAEGGRKISAQRFGQDLYEMDRNCEILRRLLGAWSPAADALSPASLSDISAANGAARDE